MNSLVGYGVSSESEDEERGEDNKDESFREANNVAEDKKSHNFLLESESLSSESESGPENDDEGKEIAHSSPKPLLTPSVRPRPHKLPPPPLGNSSSGGARTGSSVFTNPFKEMADERLNVLQKHVPLTLQARPTQIGGKRICVAYRKNGRCRFGSGCKFAHDSDLPSKQAVASGSEPKDNATASVGETQGDALASCDVDKKTNDDENTEKRKKRRIGVNDSLVPPKRALKLYARLSHP